MKVFVIMPYGGKDVNKVKEYNKIFKFLIKPAVQEYEEKAEVIRQDYTGQGGQILRNVIQNLSSSDVVIADISEQNWNVAYELGLRHVMNKFGTILLCNDATEIPYDVQNLNVLVYPATDWIDEVDDISQKIITAIDETQKRERSDSPVFDVFSALPANLADMLSSNNDEEQARIMQLSNELREANALIAQLQKRIESAGLDSTVQSGSVIDLKSKFREAIKNKPYYSDEAVAHLRELAHQKDYEGFADYLSLVLEKGYLDESDCKAVFILCRNMNVPDITRIFLETAVIYYPDNEELKAFLADTYSCDYRYKEKAISLVNECVGIRKKDGKYELISKPRTDRLLAAFFNTYLHLKKFRELIEIANLLIQTNPKHAGIVYRNISFAALELEDFELADKNIRKLLEIAPQDDVTYFVQSKYFHETGDMINAYKAREKCISLAPEDSDYYFSIAGLICDEKIARTPDKGEVVEIAIGECEQYAAPFVLRAFLNNPQELALKAMDFFRRNHFVQTEKRLLKLLKQESDIKQLIDGVCFEMVDYAINLSVE